MKGNPFMPKYELMYILASSVSDTDVPTVTNQVLQFIQDFGGQNVVENQLGKKKLAYPVKKTRNGYYTVVQFDMDGTKVNTFEAKIRTQTSTVIRHILVNLDEHISRSEKDTVAQTKMNQNRPPEAIAESTGQTTPPPAADVGLDEKIEAALNEEIK
jgi:small subunit ribosomal protein S6